MGNIRRAWCVELEETLTAHHAKREFFALEPRPEKLTFLCADEKCRDATPGGTRVTCVNYQKLPSEDGTVCSRSLSVVGQAPAFVLSLRG